MFGVICAGRPVQTEIQQIDPTKFVFQIHDGATVNHMVIFLLPGAEIPAEMAASVYFQLPDKPYRLLGYLSAEKQSAIFKINSNTPSSAAYTDIDEAMMQDDAVEQFDISVGISIEPLAVVQQVMAEQAQAIVTSKPPLLASPVTIGTQPAPQAPADIAALANKIVQHAYNFLGSFVTPDGKVPMKAFDEWWAKFKSKLQTNPKFLESLDV